MEEFIGILLEGILKIIVVTIVLCSIASIILGTIAVFLYVICKIFNIELS